MLCLQAELYPWEEVHKVNALLAQEVKRTIEAETALQCANLEIESLQAELEAGARAQSEQQSKLSLQLEYAHRVRGQFLCFPASTPQHQHYCDVCEVQVRVNTLIHGALLTVQ